MIRGFSAGLLFFALVGSTALAATLPMSAPVLAAPQVSRTAVAAADAAFKGKYGDAGALAERSGDPGRGQARRTHLSARQLEGSGLSAAIMAFLNAAPQWPLAETLLKRAEQSLYVNRASTQTVLAHFEKRKPLTSEGTLALARAQLASGNTDAARRSVRRVWLE